MNKNLSFLPINNHYSPIDLPTLKSNNFKTGTMKRKGVEMPLIIEIRILEQLRAARPQDDIPLPALYWLLPA